MKKYLFVTLGITMLMAIAALADPTQKEAKQNGALPAPEAGYARICIVRPTDVFLFEKFYVYVDKLEGKNRMGYTKGVEHISFLVRPGKHKVISEGKNRKYLIVDVKENEVVFIKQNPVRGGVGVNQDSLDLLTEEEGKYFWKLTRPGTVDVERIEGTFTP
jgi:hypothetical protein